MLGVASATLILFFISGEVSRGMARWRELKKSSAGLRGVGDSSGDEN